MLLTPTPLIDPSLELTPAEQRDVRRAAWGRWLSNPTHTVLNTVGIVGALFAFLFLPDLIEPWFGGHQWYHTLIWFGLYAAAIFGLYFAFRRYGYAPCVYRELRARGHDVCASCGYNRRGLEPETKCPECGRA